MHADLCTYLRNAMSVVVAAAAVAVTVAVAMNACGKGTVYEQVTAVVAVQLQ